MDLNLDFGIQKAYKPIAICTLDVTNLKVNEIKQSTFVHKRKQHFNTRIVPVQKSIRHRKESRLWCRFLQLVRRAILAKQRLTPGPGSWKAD